MSHLGGRTLKQCFESKPLRATTGWTGERKSDSYVALVLFEGKAYFSLGKQPDGMSREKQQENEQVTNEKVTNRIHEVVQAQVRNLGEVLERKKIGSDFCDFESA